MGDIDGDDAFCRVISKGGGVVLVSVEYGLAPQNTHPGLINDCFKGFQWTLDNAKELGGVEGKSGGVEKGTTSSIRMSNRKAVSRRAMRHVRMAVAA